MNDQFEGIEGQIVSYRTLAEYESEMEFDREFLRGKTVLNFGCGGSNLTLELKNSGIDTDITEVDLINDPRPDLETLSKPWYRFSSFVVGMFDKKYKTNYRNRIAQIKADYDKRNFRQADGRELPFEEEQFDITLALLSTYQVPDADKRQVFSELLRVSKMLHIVPINGTDFDILQELAEEQGYEIVFSQDEKRLPTRIRQTSDYDDLIKNFTREQRVARPDDVASAIKIKRWAWSRGRGSMVLGALNTELEGSLIILRRKSQ